MPCSDELGVEGVGVVGVVWASAPVAKASPEIMAKTLMMSTAVHLPPAYSHARD